TRPTSPARMFQLDASPATMNSEMPKFRLSLVPHGVSGRSAKAAAGMRYNHNRQLRILCSEQPLWSHAQDNQEDDQPNQFPVLTAKYQRTDRFHQRQQYPCNEGSGHTAQSSQHDHDQRFQSPTQTDIGVHAELKGDQH